MRFSIQSCDLQPCGDFAVGVARRLAPKSSVRSRRWPFRSSWTRAFGLVTASTFVLTAVQMVGRMGAGSAVIRGVVVEGTASFAFWVAVTAGTVAFAATWWAARSSKARLARGSRRRPSGLRSRPSSGRLAARPVALLQRRLTFSRFSDRRRVPDRRVGDIPHACRDRRQRVGARARPARDGLPSSGAGVRLCRVRPAAPGRPRCPRRRVVRAVVSASNRCRGACSTPRRHHRLFSARDARHLRPRTQLSIVVPGMFTTVSAVASPHSRAEGRGPAAFGAHLLSLHRALAA